MKYLLTRLSEASTWQGIVALLTVAGVSLSPEQGQQVIATGLAVIGLIKTFLPDTVPVESVKEAIKNATLKNVLRRGRS
ncbi:MAG: hypothetical protein L0177_18955 [Chloroflexi bacterium]|nr:hypothetical protein [Chloroflexota bacterium]